MLSLVLLGHMLFFSIFLSLFLGEPGHMLFFSSSISQNFWQTGLFCLHFSHMSRIRFHIGFFVLLFLYMSFPFFHTGLFALLFLYTSRPTASIFKYNISIPNLCWQIHPCVLLSIRFLTIRKLINEAFMKESLHYLLMSDHFLFQKALVASVKDTGLTPDSPKSLIT